MTWSWCWVLKFFKNIIPSLSYGRYRLVTNRGTFWRIFPLYVTFCGFQCFHFHMSLFLSISFQTPLKNPSRRAGGTKASGFVPPSLRDGFLRGVIMKNRKQKLILKLNHFDNIFHFLLHPFNSDRDCDPLIKVDGVLRLTGGGEELAHARSLVNSGWMFS